MTFRPPVNSFEFEVYHPQRHLLVSVTSRLNLEFMIGINPAHGNRNQVLARSLRLIGIHIPTANNPIIHDELHLGKVGPGKWLVLVTPQR